MAAGIMRSVLDVRGEKVSIGLERNRTGADRVRGDPVHNPIVVQPGDRLTL